MYMRQILGNWTQDLRVSSPGPAARTPIPRDPLVLTPPDLIWRRLCSAVGKCSTVCRNFLFDAGLQHIEALAQTFNVREIIPRNWASLAFYCAVSRKAWFEWTSVDATDHDPNLHGFNWPFDLSSCIIIPHACIMQLWPFSICPSVCLSHA